MQHAVVSHRFVRRALLLFLLLSLGLPLAAPAHAATTITQWTFEGEIILPSTGMGTAERGSGLSASTFPSGYSGSIDAWSHTGWSTAPIIGATQYVQFVIPTTGFQNISFSFAARRSSSGPSAYEFHYTADGATWSRFATGSLPDVDTWGILTHHLDAVAGLNDNPSAAIRIYGYSASDTRGTFRVDNVTISGDSQIDAAPAVISTIPTGGATGVAPAADITVTFSEAVDVAGGWFSISCASSGGHTAAASTTDNITFTLDPDADFAAGEACTVTLNAGFITDRDNVDPPDSPESDTSWRFSTLIARWNFDDEAITPSSGAGTASEGSGLTFADFTSGYGGSAFAWSHTGWSTTPEIGAAQYVQFAASTVGRQNIVLTFAARRSGTGPSKFDLYTSADGSTWTYGLTGSLTISNTWYTFSNDLSAVSALNHNPYAALRIYGYGAAGASGTLRVDDITVSGDAQAPCSAEPAVAPAVIISISGEDVALNWAADSANLQYQVWVSTNPYFDPDHPGRVTPILTRQTEYSDIGAAIGPGSHYYVARGINICGATSPNSGRVGDFTYGLVPGG